MVLWLSVTSPSVWEAALEDMSHCLLLQISSFGHTQENHSGIQLPGKKAVWNRGKLPNSDGIFYQGSFPGNSQSKTKHSQGARLSREQGVPWYKRHIRDSDSPCRVTQMPWGQDRAGLFKSLWAPILFVLFQRNNQLLLTHSWEVSVGLDAAAQKCPSSVPAQQAPLGAVSGFSCCPEPLMVPLSIDLASSLNPAFQRTFHCCHIAEPWRLNINTFIVLWSLKIFIGILCCEWIQLTQNRNYCKTKRAQHKLRHFLEYSVFSSELFMLLKSL